MMHKQTVIQLVIEQIVRDLHGLISSAKATHEEATHEQNKPENKYDTRALEASYLARGQSRQVLELEKAKQEFESLDAADWPPKTPVEIGALLTLRGSANEDVYLLGPRAGGIEVDCEGTPVTVITPQSPIGQQLLGKIEGDSITIPQGREPRRFKIVRVQ
jgi:transcription elongation GreA/GreB family factor